MVLMLLLVILVVSDNAKILILKQITTGVVLIFLKILLCLIMQRY